MSAITKIIGAIISFITGLLGGVLGIFSRKKGEFYLEIDPSKDSAAASQAVAASQPVAAAPAAATSAPAAPTTTTAPAPAAAPTASQAPTAQKKKKAAKKAKAKKAAAATPQPAVAAVNQALNMPKPKVVTIEPLDIPKFGPRRRPGSNMKSFLDMAKTVKS